MPKSNDNNSLPGPSGQDNSAACPGSSIDETSSQSHCRGLQNSSYQQMVPKDGRLLPDIKIGNLGKYIQSMLQKENALDEEFKVNHRIFTTFL